jgi:hypothetical protein
VGSALAVMYTIYTNGFKKGYKMGAGSSAPNENRSSRSGLLHLVQNTKSSGHAS